MHHRHVPDHFHREQLQSGLEVSQYTPTKLIGHGGAPNPDDTNVSE